MLNIENLYLWESMLCMLFEILIYIFGIIGMIVGILSGLLSKRLKDKTKKKIFLFMIIFPFLLNGLVLLAALYNPVNNNYFPILLSTFSITIILIPQYISIRQKQNNKKLSERSENAWKRL